MDAIAIVTDAELAKLRTYDGKEPALGAKIRIDQHAGKRLLDTPGAVFLVARRPGGSLWLVAMLWALGERGKRGWDPHPNNTPVIDLTPIAALFEPLASRVLSDREREVLRQVASDPKSVKKVKVVAAAKPKEARAPAMPPPKAKVPKKMQLLAELVAAQLDEVKDELRANAKKLLARKDAFTGDVQSIFEGSGDEARLLRDELAPWKKAADKPADVDRVAKRAIEDVCRGIVALAQDRARDVPKACASYRALLDAYVPWMRSVLA